MDHSVGKSVTAVHSEAGVTKGVKKKDTNSQKIQKKSTPTKASNSLGKETGSNVKSRSPLNPKKACKESKVNLTPLKLGQIKGGIKMVKAGTYLVPGKGIVKTPEKRHKTILNSMRKSPVKKAMEEKLEKGETEKMDKSISGADKLSPKKVVKKIKGADSVKDGISDSAKIPYKVVSAPKDEPVKVKKQSTPKKNEQLQINEKKGKQNEKCSPKFRKMRPSSASNTSIPKSRTPSKSPSPSRRHTSAQDKTVPELKSPVLTTAPGKPSRPPSNVGKKEDLFLIPLWDSDEKSPKKSPKTRSSPRSGSGSKSSSLSKQSTPSDNSSASTSTPSSSTSSSNNTVPEDSSSLANSSAKKNLFPKDKDDDQSASSDSNSSEDEDDEEEANEDENTEEEANTDGLIESPVFEGLKNCSINVDRKSLGMWKSYQYKYSLSGEIKSSNTLSDLIAKVNTNIETPDHERNKIFGTCAIVDEIEGMTSPSQEGESNEYNDSMDSDKTITDFDTAASNSSLTVPQNRSMSDDCAQELCPKDMSEVESTDEIVSTVIDKPPIAEDVEEIKDNDTIANESSTNESESAKVTDVEKGIVKKDEAGEKQEEVHSPAEISIFEHFGLKLKKKTDKKENKSHEDTKDNNKDEKESKEDDVVCLSDSIVNDVVVISDEDSMANSPVKKKFKCVNHIVEPKPIEILANVERHVRNKQVAFLSEELEEYIDVNKEHMGPLYRALEESNESAGSSLNTSPLSKDVNFNPDLDEVDGFMYVSFSSDAALKAHVEIEKQVEWVNVSTFKKISQLRIMKERQNDTGKTRLTDVKSVDQQKQNFRGLHMKYTKYQRMLKAKVESLTDFQYSTEKPLKSPEKTSDITKIKGWKKRFKSIDDVREAADSGKLHWKTEDRLLRDVKYDDMNDIGLDLKKKRRKLVNYSNKKNLGKAQIKKELEEGNADYIFDDDAITEKDVYNEEDDKPPPDKVPYSEKYLSQFKYGARKMFVKKMRLDAEDEKILKKLGTNKMNEKDKDTPVASNNDRSTRGRQLVFSKITHIIATAAVSAIDVKLCDKAKWLAETPKRSRSKRGVKDEHDGTEVSNFNTADNGVTVKQEPLDDTYANASVGIPSHKRELRDRERKKSFEKCDQPGCRYGCICHLCKVSDSSEEKESENKSPCDKEYCKLGCICESIDIKQIKEPLGHCRKPACMFECRCPPKQPKPDIPKVGRKKKKSRGIKKKLETDTVGVDDYDIKEEQIDEERKVEKEDEWEPPIKKKKSGPNNSRYANLPKRESTYRLAKNLDAVSRKAMIVYESSEMYTEQRMRMRQRKSDPMGDYMLDDLYGELDGSPHPDVATKNAKVQPKTVKGRAPVPTVPTQKLNPETGVFEISDDDIEIESYQGTCARSVIYSGCNNRRKPVLPTSSQKVPSRRKTCPSTSCSTSSQPSTNEVIELPDTDDEDKEKAVLNRQPSSNAVTQLTVSQRLGLSKNGQAEPAKWKTQMVCLKAKKKSEDNSVNVQSEIKLLEIISNCSWENDRTNMLSKISHIISKDYPPNFITMWQSYVLQFLPKAEKPAVIPPELQSKLPNSMYSIRVRVTQNLTDIEQAENNAKEDGNEKEVDEEKFKNLSEEERKKYFIKQQGKLIEKIKFAEKLRDLIKNEELKGISPSKFSVSLEGIEKALKRYKTQLWKAYTGSSNKSLMQIKQAVKALKNSTPQTTKPSVNDDCMLLPSSSESNHPSSVFDGQSSKPGGVNPTTTKRVDRMYMPGGCEISSGSLTRIQNNQGIKVNNSPGSGLTVKAFIPIGSMSSSNCSSHVNGGNITIKKQDQSLGMKCAPCMSQSMPTVVPLANSIPKMLPVTSGSDLSCSGKEVLLIPIQDSSGGNWDPSASPVFTAKVTMIPTDGVNTSVVNLTPIPSTGTMPIRMVMGPRCATTTKVSRPMLNPALTAYANAPFLPGNGNNNSPVAGNSQILFSSIQPISSGSPVFSQVQSMMTQCVPLKSMPGGPMKTLLAVSTIGPMKSTSPVNSAGPMTTILPVATSGTIMSTSPVNPGGPMKTILPVATTGPNKSTSPVDLGGPLKSILSVSTTGPTKATSSVGMYRPQAIRPGANATDIQTNSDTPNTGVEKPGNSNAFTPIRFAAPLGKATSGPVSFMPNTNTNNQQSLVLIPVSSTGSVQSGADAGSSMIAVPLSNMTPGDLATLPPTSKVVRLVSPETVGKSDDIKTPTSFQVVQNLDSTSKRDLSAGKEKTEKKKKDSMLTKGKATVDSVHNKHEVSGNEEVIVIKNDESEAKVVLIEDTEGDNIDRLESTTRSVSSDTNQADSKADAIAGEISKLHVKASDTVAIDDEVEKVETQTRLNETVLVLPTESDQILIDNKTQGKTFSESEELVKDTKLNARKRKAEEVEDDIVYYVSKRKGSCSLQELKTSASQDSGDSDVDIVSVDKDTLEAERLLQSNRRKSQQVSMSMDDFEIKTVVKLYRHRERPPVQDLPVNARNMMERSRRHSVRQYHDNLARTVFKYNPEIQQFDVTIPRIPQHLVLTEAKKLILALKNKEARLEESLADGRQYQESLNRTLKTKIDDFVQSGVPKTILKNFLKSVSNASTMSSKKKKEKQSEGMASEESDSDLHYDQLRKADILRSRSWMQESPSSDVVKEYKLVKKDVIITVNTSKTLDNTNYEIVLDKTENLDSGVYIDHAEGFEDDMSPYDSLAASETSIKIDPISDTEMVLEIDDGDVDADQSTSVVNMDQNVIDNNCVEGVGS